VAREFESILSARDFMDLNSELEARWDEYDALDARDVDDLEELLARYRD
jgi:hypothetical protein